MSDAVLTDLEVPPAPIEWRRAGDFEVRFADRIIELVAAPYDVDCIAEYPPGSGRAVVESIAPGAFDGVERRANRVKVNREHDETRTVGRAIALHPSRAEGLVAELRISHTPLGDETLELAEDRVLEPSIGMAVKPSWQTWLENRSRRRLNKVFLGHIAMLPDGAYADDGNGARVLAVRSALQIAAPPEPVPTPNLDAVLAWLTADR